MITLESPKWVSLSTIYHHVLKRSPSPERAKIEISSARRSGLLHLRAEQTREHVARPELRLSPGEQPPHVEPTSAFDQPIPDGNYLTWVWERSYATRRVSSTRSFFEYSNIVGYRDEALALWPLHADASVVQRVPSRTVDPFRTGAPGRPSAKEVILAEAKSRLSSGEVVARLRGLAHFARELFDWWEQERKKYKTPGPAMTTGTIENIVRDIWRKAQVKP